MTRQQIDKIVSASGVPEKERVNEVIETFISWILICNKNTYKIKRPVKYSFLDFSTMERRKNLCLQELHLNKQLAGDMYIEVLPVVKSGDELSIGRNGEVIDYAVRMRTMDNNKLMNVLLPYGKVMDRQIQDLAHAIADFHLQSTPIYMHADYDLTGKFNDVTGQIPFLSSYISAEEIKVLKHSIESFNELTKLLTPRLIKRVNLGFIRNCHGDLHSGNIFLMDKPVPFDRIEFDPKLRQIDVLNEIAFLCMDLEHFEEPDLSKLFFETYNLRFPCVLNEEDEYLYMLYKAYRANVCAKVNSLKAQVASDHRLTLSYIENVRRYLRVMKIYLDYVGSSLKFKHNHNSQQKRRAKGQLCKTNISFTNSFISQ
jgi:aminoglycoside phosphotransferase family enzyme